ncbi:hypothetical protein Droror1_Dr00004746 [Drosera rotundifolia]
MIPRKNPSLAKPHLGAIRVPFQTQATLTTSIKPPNIEGKAKAHFERGHSWKCGVELVNFDLEAGSTLGSLCPAFELGVDELGVGIIVLGFCCWRRVHVQIAEFDVELSSWCEVVYV